MSVDLSIFFAAGESFLVHAHLYRMRHIPEPSIAVIVMLHRRVYVQAT